MSPHAFGNGLFAGGVDQPRFQFTDIDGDHDPDLFILDKDELLWFYRNVNGTYRLEPDTTFGLRPGSWFRFVDIDHDGDLDCFSNGEFSDVSLSTNVGSVTTPRFVLSVPAMQDTAGMELFSERFSIPTFADIDGDGDLDFFSGSSIGSISFYRNTGTISAAKFGYVTSTFGGINIQGGGKGFPKTMHGASGIEFFDADSNGVLDLFWGDYFNPSLYYLYNSGTAQTPNLALVDSTYPNEAVVQSPGFNMPQHMDIDGDGRIDLMTASVFPTSEYDNFQWYRNVGTNAAPYYVLQTKNFLPMIDAGSRSSAAVADLDGDGDQDIVVASAAGTLQFYDNTGTSNAPIFHAAPQSSMHLSNNFYATVTAGDLNGDAKPDLLVGNFDGRIRTFLNTTTDGVISFQQAAAGLDPFDAGQNSAPCLADVDGDGVRDLLVGASDGLVILLRNTGGNAGPEFVRDTSFHLPDVGSDAIPSVGDIDGDGAMELLVGNSEGTLHLFRRTSTAPLTFTAVSDSFQHIAIHTQAAPCIADIDVDGDNDLLLGNGKGGLFFYRNSGVVSVDDGAPVTPERFSVSPAYPNPFNPSTTVTIELPEDSQVRVEIFDLIGRTVSTVVNQTMKSGKHFVVWDAESVPAGIYLCRVTASVRGGRTSITRKLSLIK